MYWKGKYPNMELIIFTSKYAKIIDTYIYAYAPYNQMYMFSSLFIISWVVGVNSLFAWLVWCF